MKAVSAVVIGLPLMCCQNNSTQSIDNFIYANGSTALPADSLAFYFPANTFSVNASLIALFKIGIRRHFILLKNRCCINTLFGTTATGFYGGDHFIVHSFSRYTSVKGAFD